MKRLWLLSIVCLHFSHPCYGSKLHEAAEKGNSHKVKELIRIGAPINGFDEYGLQRTPLHEAAFNGQTDVVAILLAAHANINAIDKNGRTPLELAAVQNHTEVALLLLRNGARITDSSRNRLLSAAAIQFFSKKLDLVRILLNMDRPTDLAIDQINTFLRRALEAGDIPLVELLLNRYGAHAAVITGGLVTDFDGRPIRGTDGRLISYNANPADNPHGLIIANNGDGTGWRAITRSQFSHMTNLLMLGLFL